jgi:hypothetical protein
MRDDPWSVVHSDVDHNNTFGHNPIEGRDESVGVNRAIHEGYQLFP